MGRLVIILKIGLAGFLLLLVWILTRPLKLGKLSARPKPVEDYGTALKRIQALQAQDTVEINPVCRTQLLTHGRKVERAIVFWHGYTTCPQQFCQLGQIFFDLGYNVLIPRLAHHGLTDRMSPAQAQLTAEELVKLVDEVVDVAHGLGHHLTVVGFSAGGVLAGWVAQYRHDVDQVMIISPAFGLRVVPVPLTRSFTKLLLTLPNHFRWWDPRFKANAPGPQHSYPRFSSRGLGQILRVGQRVQSSARRSGPVVSTISMVTNPNDWAVNNDLAAEIVYCWRSNGTNNIVTYEFPVELRLGHDLIDPDQAAQQVEVVYPILVDLVTGEQLV